MRVHAIRRAGDKRHQVLAVLGDEALRLCGKHDLGAGHAVGMVLPQNADDEPVPLLELVDVAQDLGGWQTGMTCEDAVR